MNSIAKSCVWTVLALATAAGASEPVCENALPLRQAYFGDLHVHTGLSADAMLFGTRNRPDDAYRFARGEEIQLRQLNSGPASLPARIARPLDFTAVTDHAENIGTISLCTTPGSAAYDTEACRFVRAPLPLDDMAVFSEHLGRVFQTMYFSEEICGPDRKRCREAVQTPWKEIRESAERWNAPCEFTTFVAYEYSPTPDGSKLHHNVIFRGREVMESPISSRDVPSMIDFWRLLREGCKQAGTGCDVLAIPHNPNLGNGQMFSLAYGGESDPSKQREIAALRAEIEPLVEIFQEKGDSECRNGMWKVVGESDPFCDFEKYRDWMGAKHEDCRDGEGSGGLRNEGCISRLDYTRYALGAGLAEEVRIGVNPHKFGVIGSTDRHDGSAADVEEWVQDGVQRLPNLLEAGRRSGGGIAGVWAVENTREALFDAMRRRETFATSGPRIRLRFFGGWDLEGDLCGDPKYLERADAEGVPMGSDLAPGSGPGAPSFLLSALADEGTTEHPGTPLQRLQIVKVWAGEDGRLHQAVHDVAGGENGASVDADSCQREGPGAAELCGVWRDPDYDSQRAALYYARAIENPSCRHTAWRCLRAPRESRPEWCVDPRVEKTLQERAWSSPIWLAPAAAHGPPADA